MFPCLKLLGSLVLWCFGVFFSLFEFSVQLFCVPYKKLPSSYNCDVSPVCGYHRDENLTFPGIQRCWWSRRGAWSTVEVLDFTVLYCTVWHSCVSRNLQAEAQPWSKGNCDWYILNLLWSRKGLSSKLEIVEEFLAALTALNLWEVAEKNWVMWAACTVDDWMALYIYIWLIIV